jgi:UDP-N-acetylglucosamine 1-carboxyvinyltransferase
MDSFRINGGIPLKGELTPQGAKNEALQVICACLLTSDEVIISNIPEIQDVKSLMEIMEGLGVEISKLGPSTYKFKAANIDIEYLNSPEYRLKGAKIRGSVMIIGPLLSRFGKAFIPVPGGDKIGRRRIDTHLIGFEKLGAKFDFDQSTNTYILSANKLTSSYMLLEEASVTGTANIVMAAVLAEGTTTIYNAACEPYLQQLCLMLNKMGAKISGIASNLLIIDGVTSLIGCTHRLLPDMIEVGSFIGLAAMTRSTIRIKDVNYDQLGIIPDAFKRLGIRVERSNDDIVINDQEHYEIETFIDGSIMMHPGRV